MPQMGFFDLSDRYASLDAKKDPLVEINAVVPWEEFRPVLERVWRKPEGDRKSRAGRKPMDAVLMFKTLVLSALYNRSDDQIEYQVRDRLSFMRFLGLGLADRVPDAKTVWLKRAALAQAGMMEALFTQFDGHLARQGDFARGGQILDASIVPVPRNHNKREENTAIKAGETSEGWADEPTKRSQRDVDACWSEEDQKTVRGTVFPTSTHGKSHYGYKNHVNVDRMHKLVPALPCHRCRCARQPGGGSPADAGQYPFWRVGECCLSVRGDGGKVARLEADQSVSPQGQSRQAADRTGQGEQPDQVVSARARRACLRRADQ